MLLVFLLTEAAVLSGRVHDLSNTGSVDFQGFKALHKFLEDMSNSFQKHDQDHSGSLSVTETQAALTSAGM